MIETGSPCHPDNARRVPSTAFVFSGGGSFGAMQVGMLSELLAAGLRPDLIVGSSVGAINGAYLAGHPTLAGVEELATIWRGLQRRRILPFSLGRILRGLRSSDAMVDPSALRALVAKSLTFTDLAEAQVPLHVMATDVATGAPIRLSRGSAVDAVLASSAIPGLLPPVQLEGRLLIDGAVSVNTPVRDAVSLRATRIIVLPAWPIEPAAAIPLGALAYGFHALSLMIARQLAADLAFAADRAEVFLVPPIDAGSLSPLDFSRGSELIDQARERTHNWLRSEVPHAGGALFPAHTWVPSRLEGLHPDRDPSALLSMAAAFPA